LQLVPSSSRRSGFQIYFHNFIGINFRMTSSMNIIAVGLNHRTAPIEVRERFAISSADIVPSLHGLVGDGVIREVTILSTCNRVEVYVVCTQTKQAVPIIFDLFQRRSGINPVGRSEFYVHEFPSSIQHLYEVCSGLDSMVVGETEILGQVKESYRVAQEAFRTGLGLNKLFQNAFSVAKEIRSRTRIGTGSVSVGSVAVDLAGQIFGDLADRKILLVGAGEMGETTARFLQSRGAKSLMVTNRSHDRALDGGSGGRGNLRRASGGRLARSAH
jgi:glutamyl-tRNA reductase